MQIKFSFKDLIDLDNDLEASKKAIPLIVMRTLRAQLAPLRNQLRSLIPRTTGRLARSFGYSVRRKGSIVTAQFGFLLNKRISASAAIAANVLQAGGARPRKGAYLWIPLPPIRNADGSAQVTPRQLISAGGFVATSQAGNKIAFFPNGLPAFILKTFVKLSRPPLPIEQRIEAEAPEIASGIEESIASVIEAKRAAERVQ
jgi:hypothetical protein